MRKAYLFFLILMLVDVEVLHSQANYAIKKDIHYYEDTKMNEDEYVKSQCTLDLHYPENWDGFTTIIWFHGGGLTGGRKEVPSALLKKGYAVVGVGYRFSPHVTAPSYIEDAAAAIAWVFKHISEYGGDNRLIFVSGHSAGAYLGMMATLDKSYLNKYNINADSIAGLIPVSGQVITHFQIRKERGISNKQMIVDEFAPIYHARKDAPPIILITGDQDKELLGRYEENAFLWRTLKLNGHENVKLHKMDGFNHNDVIEAAYPTIIREVKAIKDNIDR